MKKVEESEEGLRGMVLQAPIGICVLDASTLVSEIVNDSFIEVAGKPFEEIAGKFYWDTFAEARSYYESALTEVVEKGVAYYANEVELMLIRHGKEEVIYVTFVYEPLKNAEGKVKKVVVWVLDNTVQVMARRKTEEADKQFRNTVRQAPVGIAILRGPQFIVEMANDAYLALVDKRGVEFTGRPLFDSLPEVEATVHPLLDGVLNTGIPFHGNEYPVPVNRYGKEELSYFDFVYHPLKEDDGKISGIMVTVTDVSASVKAKYSITESEKQFRNMVMQSPIPMAIFRGKDYIIEMANKIMFEKIWRRRENDILGKKLLDAFPELIGQKYPELLKNVHATRKSHREIESLAFVQGDNDLKKFYFDFEYAPLFDPAGQVSGIMVTVNDVTEKVESRRKVEESEKRLNIVIEASKLGTWELNLNSKEVKYSRRYLEILGGYTEDINFKHEQLVNHLHPDDLSIREKAFGEALVTGYLHYEVRLIWNDKTIHWMEGRGKVFYNHEHKPEKIIGTIRDTTKEKKHAEEVEESEKRFRNLIEQCVHPILILKGEDLVMEIANDPVFKLWRVGKNMLGKPFLEILPEMKGQPFEGLLHDVLRNGVTHFGNEQPAYFKRPNGDEYIVYFNFIYLPYRESDESISGVIVQAYDVTEQVIARKKIEESEERFRSLAETLPQLIWETDESGNALFISGRWKEYTGVQPAGVLDWKAIIHPDDLEESSKTWAHSLTTGDIYRHDVRLKNKDGNYRWHTVIGEPVYNMENKLTKWVGAFTDIHSDKAFTHELEKQVLARTKELEEKNTELEKMNKELQSFAYISSHDLQEPLRKIQTFSSQIIEKEFKNLSDSGKDRFQRMQNSAKRMQTLIEDLLTYSRTNTDERKFVKTDLNIIVEDVKEDLKEELQQKHATIEAGETCEVNIIPFQFRQLMYNLISNSLKFSNREQTPHIKIKCKLDQGIKLDNKKLVPELKYCHISISDNGIGFEQQYNERIFEVFQRLHSKNEYNGTGIGLAIVKKIVENHNGIITANGVLHQGATFDIYIPAT